MAAVPHAVDRGDTESIVWCVCFGGFFVVIRSMSEVGTTYSTDCTR